MSNKERGERDNVICIERPTAKDTKKIYLFWQGKSNIADCSLALSLSLSVLLACCEVMPVNRLL